MLRQVKLATLGLFRGAGLFNLVANSQWRQQRLLILCYHGTSLEDEHLWRPTLYIDPQKLAERFEFLKERHFSILPLGEAFEHLRAGTLPPRSVALTFDDGFYDFFRLAYPLLKQYGYPATVYQTTYYTAVERPIFNLICSYLLWKRSGEVIPDGGVIGLHGRLDLRTDLGRSASLRDLIELAQRDNMTAVQKDEIAAQLARLLNIDYEGLKAKRILQLMNRRELEEITRNGVDVQLHTHRHRTPQDEALFRREIRDNRSALQDLHATRLVHFCYPSGVYRREFLPWLQKENVITATTCDAGLAAPHSESLLLPRYVDHQNRTELDFESWLTGMGDLLAVRRKAG